MLILTLAKPLSGAKDTSFRFSEKEVSIGRLDGNDLVLPVAHISSRHAMIHCRAGRYLLSDLGSTNGSMVLRGTQRLILGPKGVAEVELESGDELVLGDIDDPVRLQVTLAVRPSIEAVGGPATIVASRNRADTLSVSLRVAGDHPALQVLYRLVAAINRLTESDRILGQVVEAALEAIPGAVDAMLAVSEGDGEKLRVAAEAHRGRGLSRTPNARICTEVLGGDSALLFGQHDASSVPAQTLVDQGVGSGIAAPLWGDDRVMGVLQINCKPGRFELSESHLDLAVVLAHQAAMALQRAGLVAQLQAAQQRLRDENTLLRRRTQPEVEMVAQSPAMRRALEDLRRAAVTDVTVLLQGETGTGKEVAARFLHANSPRRAGLLVPVNCGALTETLLDSELFGHRRGAFTGASSDRRGAFEVARGGTIFLDEIGETPPALQVRLLRVLEEGKIKVVGETVEKPVDVRIVAATNRDLAGLVEQGRFRRDLYYRLNVFRVTLPPLRERPEDIEPLCRLFIRRYARQMAKQVGDLDPDVLDALSRYTFPGNIRELANAVERAVVCAGEGAPLTSDQFDENLLPAPTGHGQRTLREQLDAVERQIIATSLERNGGSKTAAARDLGLTRQGLSKKMNRLGL